MAVRDLILRFIGKDETTPVVEDIEKNSKSAFEGIAGSGVAAAAAIIAAFGKALDTVNEIFERGQESVQALQIATGGGSELQIAQFARLQEQGFGVGDASSAVATLSGRFPGIAGGEQADLLAFELAQAERAGVSSGDIGRVATRFGFADDAVRTARFANVVYAGAAAQDANPGQVFSDIRSSAAVLQALELDELQSAQLVLDTERAGTDFSALGFGLDRLQREAIEADVSPRVFAEQAFDILAGPTTNESRALGLELFGSRGATQILPLVQSGAIGFGEQLSSDYLAGDIGLGNIQPTTQQLAEGVAASRETRIAGGTGSFGDYTGAAVEGLFDAIDDIPLIGGFPRSARNLAENIALSGDPRRDRGAPIGERFSGLTINVNAGVVADEQRVREIILGILEDTAEGGSGGVVGTGSVD